VSEAVTHREGTELSLVELDRLPIEWQKHRVNVQRPAVLRLSGLEVLEADLPPTTGEQRRRLTTPDRFEQPIRALRERPVPHSQIDAVRRRTRTHLAVQACFVAFLVPATMGSVLGRCRDCQQQSDAGGDMFETVLHDNPHTVPVPAGARLALRSLRRLASTDPDVTARMADEDDGRVAVDSINWPVQALAEPNMWRVTALPLMIF
jgi:hypothetical protein